MTFCWLLFIVLNGYINCSHIYILKHLTVVFFQYVYSQLHLFRIGANMPINRHPPFHFKKFFHSFIRVFRERESDTILFVVHRDCSASSMCCSSFYLWSILYQPFCIHMVCKFYFISLKHWHRFVHILFIDLIHKTTKVNYLCNNIQ